MAESRHATQDLVRRAEVLSDALAEAFHRVNGGMLPSVNGNTLRGHLRAFLIPMVELLGELCEGSATGPMDLVREITQARKEKRVEFLRGRLDAIKEVRFALGWHPAGYATDIHGVLHEIIDRTVPELEDLGALTTSSDESSGR